MLKVKIHHPHTNEPAHIICAEIEFYSNYAELIEIEEISDELDPSTLKYEYNFTVINLPLTAIMNINTA
jgi:hypothetical protein